MKRILKESILEETLPFTLLIEGVPESYNEDIIRSYLIKYIINNVSIFTSFISHAFNNELNLYISIMLCLVK